jgi:lipopolysaccharide biosynthesis protein
LIAILLYVYHTEIWDEIYPLLHDIKHLSSLYLSIFSDHDNTQILQQSRNLNVDKITVIQKNHGVDISPFLYQINTIDHNKYPYFIKLHSKKSLLAKKINWRAILYNSLIGSSDIVKNNLLLFQKNNSIGALTDKSMIMNNIGHNKLQINYLCKLLDINNKKRNFMGGSMFMGQTHLFQKYLNDNTVYSIDALLEDGAVKDDNRGTFCHAMERIFGKIVFENNLIIKGSDIEPSFKILNTQHKQKYSFYKTYNNYCYNTIGPKFFGKVLQLDNKELVVDWLHMQQTSSIIQKYHKNTNQYYLAIS